MWAFSKIWGCKAGRLCAIAMGTVIVIGVSGCNTLQSIAVQPPARTVFGQGQELDTLGLAVTANYKKNSETVTNTDSLQITGYDKSRPGEQTITVTMNAQSGFVSSKASNTFIVTVVPVERLSISRPPATTSFKQGDDFDPAGLSVLAEFADAASGRNAWAGAADLLRVRQGQDGNPDCKRGILRQTGILRGEGSGSFEDSGDLSAKTNCSIRPLSASRHCRSCRLL